MLSVVGHLCAAVVFTRDLIINSKILYFTFSLSLSLSLSAVYFHQGLQFSWFLQLYKSDRGFPRSQGERWKKKISSIRISQLPCDCHMTLYMTL